MNHHKDPYKPTSISMESSKGFFRYPLIFSPRNHQKATGVSQPRRPPLECVITSFEEEEGPRRWAHLRHQLRSSRGPKAFPRLECARKL